jgi:hypothetical protein
VRRAIEAQRSAARGIHGKSFDPDRLGVVLGAGEIEQLCAAVERLTRQSARLGAMRR